MPARIRLETFLAARSPLWRQVGRVCFHLAENKKDPEFPFVPLRLHQSGTSRLGLSRGRAYVRNGSVCHLEIDAGTIRAKVAGSRKRLAVSCKDFAVVLGVSTSVDPPTLFIKLQFLYCF
ncbi:MAG: hypothetical protein ACLQMF_14325 [Rectinemataceae bacterium]